MLPRLITLAGSCRHEVNNKINNNKNFENIVVNDFIAFNKI